MAILTWLTYLVRLTLKPLGPFEGPFRFRRILWALVEFNNDQKSVRTCVRGLRMYNLDKVYTATERLEILRCIIGAL